MTPQRGFDCYVALLGLGGLWAGAEKGMDWDDGKRTLHITDPYLRFYLRWQVRKTQETGMLA
jgi:hypothetical protein